jgi:hypothetical protein
MKTLKIRKRHGIVLPVVVLAGCSVNPVNVGTENTGGTRGTGNSTAALGPGPSLPAVDIQTACAVPDGHVLPYTTTSEVEAHIVGDWLKCSSDGTYPSSYGEGIRILADHTWYSLVRNASCGYDPVSTGFEGYGTWTASNTLPDTVQFNFGNVAAGFNYCFPHFSDTGQLQLDRNVLYVPMPPADTSGTKAATDSACAGGAGTGS